MCHLGVLVQSVWSILSMQEAMLSVLDQHIIKFFEFLESHGPNRGLRHRANPLNTSYFRLGLGLIINAHP